MRLHPRTLLLLGAVVLLSCRGTHPPSTRPTAEIKEAQLLAQRLPLPAYLGRAGLRWVFQIRPKALLSHKQFRRDWAGILRPKGIAALSHITGVDLQEMEEIWVAGYGLGALYLFDGSQGDLAIEEGFRNRAASLGETRLPADDLLFLTGIIDEVPFALLRLEHHLVAIAEGDPGLLQFAEARALGKVSDAPGAFGGKHLRAFEDEYSEAPFRAFALGPFAEARDGIVAQFVAGVLALSPSGGKLTLEAKAAGVWPLTESTDSEMMTWLSQLIASREFRALGLDEVSGLQAPTCTKGGASFGKGADFTVCESRSHFDSKRLAEAIWRTTSAEMSDIVGAGDAEATPFAEPELK